MAFLKNIVIASMAVAAVSAASQEAKKEAKKVGEIEFTGKGSVPVFDKDGKITEYKMVQVGLGDKAEDVFVKVDGKGQLSKEVKDAVAAKVDSLDRKATKENLKAATDMAVDYAQEAATELNRMRKPVKGDAKFDLKKQVVVLPEDNSFIVVKEDREESCCDCDEEKTRQTYDDVPCCVDPASACACYAANGCCSCCECWSPYYWFFRCFSNESDSCCASTESTKEQKKTIHSAAKISGDHIPSDIEEYNFSVRNQIAGVNHDNLTKDDHKHHATAIRVTDYYTVQRQVDEAYYKNVHDYPTDYFVPCYCSPNSACGCYAYNGCCSSCNCYHNYYTVGEVEEKQLLPSGKSLEFVESKHYHYTVDKSYVNQTNKKTGTTELAYDYNSSCCGTTKNHHKEHEKKVEHHGKHMIATKLTNGVTMYTSKKIASEDKTHEVDGEHFTTEEYLQHFAKLMAGDVELKVHEFAVNMMLSQVEAEQEAAFYTLGAWMENYQKVDHEECYMQWGELKIKHTKDVDFKENFLQRVVKVDKTTPQEYVIMREEYISKDAKHHDAEMPCCMDPNGSCGNYAYNGGCACCGCYEDVYVAVDQEALGHQKKEESCCSCSSEEKETKKTHLRNGN